MYEQKYLYVREQKARRDIDTFNWNIIHGQMDVHIDETRNAYQRKMKEQKKENRINEQHVSSENSSQATNITNALYVTYDFEIWQLNNKSSILSILVRFCVYI